MCLHKEIREFILPITGKNYTCIHIPSRENIVFIYRRRKNALYISHHRRKKKIIYIPSREMFIIIHVPSRESIRFISHLRKMFKFTIHRGKFSYSYPIQEIVHVHIPSRENKTHHKSANINCCIMNV
jgi:hypothetical protein